MNKKVCVITGASSGIGKEIALKMAESQYHVVLICRNEQKAKNALAEIKGITGSNDIEYFIADLSSKAKVRSIAKILQERIECIDILINNAGLVATKRTLSVDGLEMTLATNHLAPFLLTKLLLVSLSKSEDARVINISSAIHKWAKLDLADLQFEHRKYHFMKAYAQSKLLMNLTSFELLKKLTGTKITVNCVHPGAVKTNLGSDNAKSFATRFADKLIKLFFITPRQAAQFPFELATLPAMKEVTGKYFVKGKAVSASPICYDEILQQQVWNITEQLVDG